MKEENMERFNGYVGVYQDRNTGETLLGTPYTEGNEPKFWEYDCAAYRLIGKAKISIEIETSKDFNFKFIQR